MGRVSELEMGDTTVKTVSSLAQWRIDNFGPCSYKKSDAFKFGLWNWHLSIEKNKYLYIRLFPELSTFTKDQPPIARFILRVSNVGFCRRPYISPIHERLIRNSDDFVWPVDTTFYGCFIIDVEFLDLKICPLNGGEATSIWPSQGDIRSLSTQSALQSISLMLYKGIYADVTVNTADGSLKAHKSILSASSPMFRTMFLHDLSKKESSIVQMDDVSSESCMVLLSYLYGTIKPEEFWKHRLSFLGAANKYAITDLKDACEESLLEDINSGNVLERLREAWIYQLDKLKRGCLMYLFEVGKIYDVKDEINNFFKGADRDLLVEMFQKFLVFDLS